MKSGGGKNWGWKSGLLLEERRGDWHRCDLDDEEIKRAKKAKVEARLDAGLPARNRKRGGNRRDEYFSPELPHDPRL